MTGITGADLGTFARLREERDRAVSAVAELFHYEIITGSRMRELLGISIPEQRKIMEEFYSKESGK